MTRRQHASFEDAFAQLFRFPVLIAVGLGAWGGTAYAHRHHAATVFQDACYAALIAAAVYAAITFAHRRLSRHTTARSKKAPAKRRRR